jgi:four helix bundle protein
MQNFKDLIAWQKSHAVVLKIYIISRSFPKDEQFGLTPQIRRASVSITSNIAEGFGRNSSKEKSHFYGIAKGSLFEVQNQLLIAKDLEYLSVKEFDIIDTEIVECLRLISGLVKSSVDRLP